MMFEPIQATAPNGDQLSLVFSAAKELDERRGRPGCTYSVTATFTNHTVDEIREQSVYPEIFCKGWRETAARRMATMDPDCITPQVVISHRGL